MSDHLHLESALPRYSAPTRVFLVWSAFERYSELAGSPPPYRQLFSLVPKIELEKLADHIPDQKLFVRLQNRRVLPPHGSKFLPTQEALAWREKHLVQ